jgi:cobalt-zinc-cadmium efflux system membrane fusion protein
MNVGYRSYVLALLGVAALQAGCTVHGSDSDTAAAAPPAAVVEHEEDGTILRVEHPDRFPLVAATARESDPELTVTGVVSPDVSRAVPVVSFASGRVIDVGARLGDSVKKGAMLARIQSADVSSAAADYRKARADQGLAQTQLERAQELFERGAMAKKDLEVAQDTQAKAAVDVDNAAQRLHVLGVDANHAENGVVDIVAPVSGVVTEQNIALASGVKTLDNSPNLFTISDLSHVWIVCDVYENDLAVTRVGDRAEIRLAAYPDRMLTGRIGNIGAVLDPNLRTAKVRIEVNNPGLMRVGMFVTATFHGQRKEMRTVVPATAVLHLRDHDWVYEPDQGGGFRRQQVVSGAMLPGHMQELISGLKAGDRVVTNALVFENTVDQ